ncbi:MAG: hypothetical protein ACE37B_08220 [Ilumatobacter sp.]|uniref:hypothetical protein n=1 Tax=Ilumatobacter sp. TaxID=1967498 RepID=UPI00391D8BD4
MNTTTDTNTIPGFATTLPTSSHSRNLRPGVKRLVTALAGASLIIGAGAISANALADDGPVRCEASGPGTADSLVRAADTCEQRYTDCMGNAPGTPDSLERWVDHCYAKASA